MTSTKNNSARSQLIRKHKKLVEIGDYLTAKVLLSFLRNRSIALGLGDVDNAVEVILEGVGLTPTYSRSYGTAYFKL